MASTRQHKPVQLRVAAEKHHQVHARQLESGLLHSADKTVHQGVARQQNLSVSLFDKRI